MFAKYTSILALATVALAAPLADPEACRAGVPMVTVTTYVTGYPPAATPPASSSSSDVAVPSPTPGAFYENVSPKPAKPNPPTTFSTLTAPSTPVAPPPPPPPPATYQPAPKPPQTTTTKASNTEPTYSAPPPPPPPPPPSNGPTYGTPPPKNSGSGTRSMTPHDKWSSSVGVVGCKINTNRVAYWPETPQIGRYCVKVSYKGRSVHLLHIDQSGGANDMSYDAWNYLATGKSATESPHCGGGINMEYEWVANSECSDLILDGSGKLPLLATNCEFALTAPEPRDQYVQLYNFKDLQCEMGVDEPCKVPDYAAGFNQPICPSGLGMSSASTGYVFKDLPYVTKANCPVAT